MREISAAAEKAGLTFKIRVQVRNFDAMCRMVAVGLGVCILPRSSAQPQVASMGLHVARGQGIETLRELVLMMRSRAAWSGAAKALVALIGSEQATGDR